MEFYEPKNSYIDLRLVNIKFIRSTKKTHIHLISCPLTPVNMEFYESQTSYMDLSFMLVIIKFIRSSKKNTIDLIKSQHL